VRGSVDLQAAGDARSSLTDRVYASLKGQILRREIGPGVLLTESQLAQRHGVSKTPAREALRRLHHEGLVEIVPYSGYLIQRVSLEEARDLIEVRRILEGEAAYLAAARISDDEIAELRTLARASYRSGDAESFAEFLIANRTFHVTIATRSDNALLAKMVGDVLDKLQMALYRSLYGYDPAVATADHVAMTEALARRDGAAARHAVYAEVDKLQERLVRGGVG
jgi:DNA-binding GntR family transcriptional regulator